MPDHSRPALPPAPPHPPAVQPAPRGPFAFRRRPQFQFGLRSLLIFSTVVALVAPLLPGYGMQIFGGLIILLFMVVIPVALGTFALYCRGLRQTFFLGAFAASLTPYLLGGRMLWSDDRVAALAERVIALFVIQAFACGVCGCVAVASRRFIERRRWHVPDNGPPES